MAENRPCKKDLLEQINKASFAVDDVKLYLDTHPGDAKALEYFCECQEQRKSALKEYAKYYEPLTVDTVDADGCGGWDWIETPWPWQEGGC